MRISMSLVVTFKLVSKAVLNSSIAISSQSPLFINILLCYQHRVDPILAQYCFDALAQAGPNVAMPWAMPWVVK